MKEYMVEALYLGIVHKVFVQVEEEFGGNAWSEAQLTLMNRLIQRPQYSWEFKMVSITQGMMTDRGWKADES